MYDVKEELELRSVDYVPSGTANVMVSCPFHEDNHPSLGVSLETGAFNCFGCGARGPLWRLLAAIDGVSETEAKQQLEEKINASAVVGRIMHSLDAADDYVEPAGYSVASFHKRYWPAESVLLASHYLVSRGISQATMRTFDLRFSSSGVYRGRVIIPIYAETGRLISWTARTVHKGVEPKTRKHRPAKSVLFGLYQLRRNPKLAGSTTVVVVEGEFDAMYMQQHGYAAVALMGSSISRQQLAQLLPFDRVQLALDGDAAGFAAAKQLRSQLSPWLVVDVVRLPEGKDPDNLRDEQLHVLFGAPHSISATDRE